MLLLAAKTRTGPDHGVRRGLRDRSPRGSGPGSRATIDVCVPDSDNDNYYYDDIIILPRARVLFSVSYRLHPPLPDGYIAPMDFCFPASYNIISNLEHAALYILCTTMVAETVSF